MTWKNPEFFWLLLPVVGLVAWTLWRGRRMRPSLQMSSLRVFKDIPRGWRARLSHVPTLLKFLALALMVVALARPQEASTKVKRNIEGIDIILTLDISDSMLIEDMQPNRMEASKRVIKEFIEGRSSDRIGLIVFSGESYTRVPPTLDYKILLGNLAEVKTDRNLKMGTAIGVALANAVSRLKDSTAKTRVVIFLTDGENNSGTIAPETALEIAKGYGVKIYSIGMGVDGDAQLPIYSTDAFGNTIKRYQPMHSKVNDDLLNRMASETGGKYYRATTAGALGKVFDDINRQEKTKIEVNKFTKYTELFPQYLRWAVLFLLGSLVFERWVLRRVP